MEKKQVKCPKCGTVQQLQRHCRHCVKCNLDFQAYAAYLRKKKAAQAGQPAPSSGQPTPSSGQPTPSSAQPTPPKPRPATPAGGSPLGKEGSGVQAKSIVCPKCRMRQPLRPKCAKCGFDIKSYVLQKQQGGTPDINVEKPIAPTEPPKSEWGESRPLRPDQFGKDDNPFDSSSRYWAPPASDAAPSDEPSGEQAPDPWAPTGEGLREIGKLFSDAWAMYTKRLGTLMGVYISAIALAVMPMVLMIALGAVAMPLSPDLGIFIAIGFGTMGSLLFIYLGSWGYSSMYFAVTDRTLGFKSAWSYGRTRIWSMFGMLLLLGYLIQGTILLFIIPGIFFAVYSSLTKFVLIDEGATGMDAVLRSRHYIKGNGWAVFGRLCLIWLLAMAVSAVPFIGPILSLFATPFTMAYLYLIYRDLQAAKQGLPGFVPSRGEKAKWLIAATMGFILALSLIAAAGFFIYKKYGGDFQQLMQMMQQGQMQDFEGMMEQDDGSGSGRGFGDQGTFGGPIDSDVVRPYEYERIRGIWTGTDSRGNDFTFNFMDGYYAAISSGSLGLNYGAELFVDFDLGYDPSIDAVRVPSGASLMDFKVVTSTNPSDIGQVSAGVYSLAFDRDMRLCVGRPGSGVRPTEYEPSAEVVCFSLTRGASAPPATKAPASDKPQGRLARTQKGVYFQGEGITIEFSGLPGNKQDWITLVKQNAATDTYGQWFYTSGSKSGTFTFSGMQEGDYEVRVYFDWPSGGYTVQDRHYVRVGSGGGTSGASGAGVMPSITLNKNAFNPGDPINVAFTAPSTYKPNAWIGIIPSHVSHGSESENDSYDLSYQYLQGQTTGIMVFYAPSSPGNYDIRMNDTDDNGREVAYASFTVATGSYGGSSSGGSGGSSREAPSEQTTRASAFIYSWNYKGEVRLNGEVIQVLEGEPNVQYSYNTFANLKRGRNIVDVIHNKVPGHQNYSMEIRFSPFDSDKKYGNFELDGSEGSKRFTFDYP